MSPIDLETTLRWTCSLVGISLLIGCLEDLSRLQNFRPDGLFSWRVFSTQFTEANSPIVRPILARLFGYGGVRVLHYFQLAAILVIVVPILPVAYCAIPVTIVLAIKLALVYRCAYGSDGSDQMETMVLVGLVATLVLFSSSAAALGIWFIALQSALAYFTSGVSKVFSPAWMSGDAAFKIFNTYTYGMAPVASFFRQVSIASAPLCWGLVAYECLFPASLFVPMSLVWTIFGLGLLFHTFNAFVMGLNKFFWAFLSTYPAILYCNREIAAWLATR